MQWISVTLLVTVMLLCSAGDFTDAQRKFPRVRAAFAEKNETITNRLSKLNINVSSLSVHLVSLKQEQSLQVWVKDDQHKQYQLYKSFAFCSTSGKLGPKRQQGDGQIPEGLYEVVVFNPASSFHLSLGTNYPNASDKARAAHDDPGNHIYIHGACVTIGCIPITDDGIKELYCLCVMAKDANASPLTAHFFPFAMTQKNLVKWAQQFPQHHVFWKELQPFYQHFNQHKSVPAHNISAEGAYQMKTP